MVAFNCRPVSLLPIIPNVNEGIVHDQINTFLNENNILHNCESGIRIRRIIQKLCVSHI